MKKKWSKVSVLVAAGLFGLSTMASADHLDPPTNVTCPIVGNVIQVDWDDVEDAKKYSVHVVATYDIGVPEDITDDTTVDWDFGTGDRTDGFPASRSDLMIPLEALLFDFGFGPQPAVAIQLRVKGLHPGKGQGRQNNEFVSGFCVPLADVTPA